MLRIFELTASGALRKRRGALLDLAVGTVWCILSASFIRVQRCLRVPYNEYIYCLRLSLSNFEAIYIIYYTGTGTGTV